MAHAQSEAGMPSASLGNTVAIPPQEERARNSPTGGQGEEPGMPYSTLFRQTGMTIPGVVQPLPVPSGITGEAVGGESFTGGLSLSGLTGSLRLDTGANRPPNKETAQLKLGPVYVHLDGLTAQLIFSDVRAHPTGSSQQWFSWITTDCTVVADIGERFNIALRGEFFYLPFKNQVGVGYSSNLPALAGLLSYMFPSFRGQVAYTVPVAGWPITLADDFRLLRGQYSNAYTYTFEDLRSSSHGNGQDSTVYTFGRQSWGKDAATNLDTFGFGVLSNVGSLSTEKYVLGDSLFSARVSREDLWYIPQQAYLPRAMERLESQLISQRETLRFKPFVRYNATHIEGYGKVSSWLRAGLFGPVTDQLQFMGEAGYYFGQRDSVTGEIQLQHVAGPSTTESLTLTRTVDLFEDQFFTGGVYELKQILGPSLSGRIFVSGGDYSRIRTNILSSQQVRAGIGLTCIPGLKTEIRWETFCGRVESVADQGHEHGDFIASQVDIRYRITDSIDCGLVYSYSRGDQYADFYSRAIRNLAFLSIRKTFR